MNKRIHPVTTFFRYNIVAMIATAVDFSVLVFLTEVVGSWYMFSAVMGAVSGGIVAFILERNWTFMRRDGKIDVQIKRYVFIWLSSMLLNVAFLYLFVEFVGLQYIISKLIVAVIIGIGFNFVTHKYYIFK